MKPTREQLDKITPVQIFIGLFSFIINISGYISLFYYSWKIGIGVFLILWSINIEKELRKQILNNK